MFYVYILRTSGDTLYIGQTNNLERRLAEHRGKTARSAKYLRPFTSFELVYQEIYPTQGEALSREFALKQLTRAQKEAVIGGQVVR